MTLPPRPDIVFMSSRDWDSLPLQTHYLAEGYARLGCRVFFINQTLQKWPRLSHLLWRLNPKSSSGRVSSYSRQYEVPGVVPVTLWTGPPIPAMRVFNRLVIRRSLRDYDIRNAVFVTWVPTYTALDIIDIVQPTAIGYVNHHNFDADDVLPDLLVAERVLIDRADHLFADSLFLQARVTRLSGNRVVHRSMPGVYWKRFRSAFRGDELQRLRTIYYFGDIGTHLNLAAYNYLAESYEVVLVGIVNPAARKLISQKIRICSPVSVMDLPNTLRDADILATLYLDSPYMRGVIPAKFFECLATGKPVLVSGLAEAESYRDLVNIVGEIPESIAQAVRNLPYKESESRRSARDAEARLADWDARCRHFQAILTPGLKLAPAEDLTSAP
ncbi:MAG: hypothetical protein IPH48_07245 [bacterium]|nr:hypothetical protein [bacterium]